MNRKLIITVGRSFGSGGAEVGRQLSALFDIPYYDKRLIFEAAKRTGLSSEAFAEKDEKVPGTLMHALATGFGLSSAFSSETLFQLQSETLREVASQSCVIIGRCADYILRNDPDCFNIFIHAPTETRIATIARRMDVGLEQAEEMMLKKDKSRAAYYDFYTDKKWGVCSSYNLSVDSSILGAKDTARYIKEFIEKLRSRDQNG